MTTLIHFSALVAGSLVAAVWEGLVLAAVVAICLRLQPGITAAARSLIWSVAMLIVVALPFVHFHSASALAPAHQLYLDERVSLALLCFWVAFSLFRAAQLLTSAVYLHDLARHATPITVDSEIAALLHHKRVVALCVSEKVDRPSVVGFFSPRILIPTSLLSRLSPTELQQIVLHEMEHLRRGDDWTNLLQKLSLVLFPLNPALFFIERRLCLERELACDDQVLRATNARKAYAACLANLAEHSLVRRGVSLALGAWERRPELVRRVHRILSRSNEQMSHRRVVVAVGVMLLGLLAGGDVLAHSPQLVSFGPAVTSTAALELPAAPQKLIGGHITLANAVIPTAPMKVAHRRNVRRRPTMMQPLQFAEIQRRSDGDGMVVLVTWHAVVSTGAATPQSSQFSYAAVPVRNGWLFVQL